MGQIEHRAYKKLKEAQEKAKRNPYFSDLKEEVKNAKIEWYEAKEEERKDEENTKKLWGF